MKKSFIAIVGLAVLASATPSHAQIKIGTVDMNAIFTSYSKTKEAEAELNTARTKAKEEIDKKLETLKADMDEINNLNAEAEKAELSDEAKSKAAKSRDEKIQDARNLDRSIAEFRQSQERQLQEQYLRMRKDIVEDIMRIITEKVKNTGYDIVFDKSGLSMGQIPLVLFSRQDLDFSADISKVLGASAPKAAAPAKK